VKQLVLSLALLVVSSPGRDGAAPGAPITLYTQYQHEPPQAVEIALRDELASIMQAAGLRFDWRSLDGHKGNETTVELAVIHFHGRCDTADLVPLKVAPGALGWTHVSDGEILPFSDVDCDHVRDFVQRDLLHLPAEARRAVFGRALARVLAHELYHIFAHTPKHSRCGVAKSAYTVEELLGDEFVFEWQESEALRSGARQSPGEVAGGS